MNQSKATTWTVEFFGRRTGVEKFDNHVVTVQAEDEVQALFFVHLDYNNVMRPQIKKGYPDKC